MAGFIRSGVSNAIGLTQEYREQRKRSKSPNPEHIAGGPSASSPSRVPDGPSLAPPPYKERPDDELGDISSDPDEANWALDDAQNQQSSAWGQDAQGDVDKLLEIFRQRHPEMYAAHGQSHDATRELPIPVVLPQRRPEHKERGFVRAYAPVLQDCGIDSRVWFDFLDGFHNVIKVGFAGSVFTNPWLTTEQYHPAFHAVNLAAFGAFLANTAMYGPSVIGHVVGFVAHTSIEAGRRTFIQYK